MIFFLNRRAHGHTAEEQTQLCRNRVMATHLLHMEELIEKQSHELQVKDNICFIHDV